MTAAPALRIDQRQSQTLTPRLQHAVRLLQLSSLDFAQEVQAVLAKNPFLENDESDPDPATAAAPAPAAAAEAVVEAPAAEPEAAPTDDGSWERDSWVGMDTSSRQNWSDGDTSMMDATPADVSLHEHLHEQLNLMPLSERDRVLVGTIVESLDDDGYLRTDLEELAGVTGLSPAPQDGELAFALRLVQSLDPLGVAARSVGECLLLQLSLIEDEADRELARRIVTDHMDRLAQRNVPALAKALDAECADVERVCERIRHLDPRPGWQQGCARMQYVTPDVIVTKTRKGWHAALNPAIVPRVRLNSVYAEMFQRHRDASHSALATHLQEARWTLRNVEQRFSTILAVSQAILKRQHLFLEHGALAMKPLGLREIADEVGIHESTVSRVTNNKYMATPVGVFELKYFFSRAMPTLAGGACSATAIRGVIAEMIAAENPTTPLSDAEIAKRLERQGLKVARRTVTKYRQLLQLPPVEGRRRHQQQP